MADLNIALNKPATASSFVLPYAPSRAVDGTTQPTSRWLCNTLPASMTVDLGTRNIITAWTVRHMGTAGWRTPDYNMSNYSLRGSNDNSNWYTIDSVVNNTVAITSRTVACAYRYVMLYVTKGLLTNPQLASIMELEIYGHAPNASLASLAISSGALTPAFTPATLAYTAANVPYGTSSVTVAATAGDPTSTIKVNGVAMTGGQSTVNLNVGSNTINVLVTALDGVTTKTYTITVVREQGAVLSNLTISSGTLNPTFSSNTLAYTTQNVGYDTTSVTVTPTTSIPGCTITVNGNAATSGQPSTADLAVGSNTINIVVTNGAASQTYTITIVRASSPYLSAIRFSTGRVPFAKNVYTANVTVGNATTSTVVTATAEDSAATTVISLNGTTYANGTASIPLVVGINPINIQVTSAIGVDSRTYVYNVTRSAT